MEQLSETIQVRVTKKTRTRLEKEARAAGIPLSFLIRIVLGYGLDELAVLDRSSDSPVLHRKKVR